jgi:hypothetical protein
MNALASVIISARPCAFLSPSINSNRRNQKLINGKCTFVLGKVLQARPALSPGPIMTVLSALKKVCFMMTLWKDLRTRRIGGSRCYQYWALDLCFNLVNYTVIWGMKNVHRTTDVCISTVSCRGGGLCKPSFYPTFSYVSPANDSQRFVSCDSGMGELYTEILTSVLVVLTTLGWECRYTQVRTFQSVEWSSEEVLGSG